MKPPKGNHTQLLISYQQPHKPVTTDTNARWLKTVLDKAGIDTNIFHAHSTRAASNSAAKTAKLSVNTIMTAAGWTNAFTFSEFCDKPVISESTHNSENFGHNLLQSWYPLHGDVLTLGQPRTQAQITKNRHTTVLLYR